MTNINPSYEKLVENAPIGIFQVTVNTENLNNSIADPENLYVNKILADILSFDSPEHLRSEIASIEYANPDDEKVVLNELSTTGRLEAFETELVTNNGEPVNVLLSVTLEDGKLTGYAIDITDQKRLERKAEEQAEAILEQSMPIVEIWEGITLATVVGTLDTNRAQQLTEALLTEITENESDIALVDITGVPNVDTATAQHLIDTVNAVSLLGSKVIITGINPEIAQTLVQLGITMDEIQTKSSLSDGLKFGLNLIRGDSSVSSEIY